MNILDFSHTKKLNHVIVYLLQTKIHAAPMGPYTIEDKETQSYGPNHQAHLLTTLGGTCVIIIP
jgi:hypothetical protein